MPGKSAIEWTDATWNPVTGCTKVSRGCDHCYAERFAERWRGIPGHPYEQGFDLKLWPERLTIPIHWQTPRRIFVNSMSDLWHPGVPVDFVADVFAVMAMTPQHTYQVLTKRPQRQQRLMADDTFARMVWDRASQIWTRLVLTRRGIRHPDWPGWPLPNVWAGTSVEDQEAAYRLDFLARTPAVVRFVSAEPLLGPLDLTPWLGSPPSLEWVITGGESGPGCRPVDPDWIRAIRDDCQAAGVPFLFKQWGGITSKAGGRVLDGRTWDAYPDRVLVGG